MHLPVPAVLSWGAATVTNMAGSCRYNQLQDLNVDYMVLSLYYTAITLFCPKLLRIAPTITIVEITLHD